ncbi:MAG: BREX system ATP-binding protein BrxD [Planctomycetes bacterium]|nr:BREX system ATP-binding protein BrxD [Planctomycetota bacterium]
MVSPQRRAEILDALRRGTVPAHSLDAFAVGLERFERALDEELKAAAARRGQFKAVRGDYGCGKTFLARWLEERARKAGFASAEVQISETETPLHRIETVYRRLMESLATSEEPRGAFRAIVDGWFYRLEEDVLASGEVEGNDADALLRRTGELMEQRLQPIAARAPLFAAALRTYREALASNDTPVAEGLIAWISGQPNVAAHAKRQAGIKGEIDHFGAASFLEGLLLVLRDAGFPGLLLVLDEVETLQRVRSDVRDKGLNALRQLLDDIDAGRFPGLYLVITGTPAFFDGPQGIQRLAPLAQRLHTDFDTDPKFDNPRSPQIRLRPFDFDSLVAVGRRVRELYAAGSSAGERVLRLVDDSYLEELARAVSGKLGGKVGVAPRIFLKKLVGDVLDRVDQFEDFDPRRDYRLTLRREELSEVERNLSPAENVDQIELDL